MMYIALKNRFGLEHGPSIDGKRWVQINRHKSEHVHKKHQYPTCIKYNFGIVDEIVSVWNRQWRCDDNGCADMFLMLNRKFLKTIVGETIILEFHDHDFRGVSQLSFACDNWDATEHVDVVSISRDEYVSLVYIYILVYVCPSCQSKDVSCKPLVRPCPKNFPELVTVGWMKTRAMARVLTPGLRFSGFRVLGVLGFGALGVQGFRVALRCQGFEHKDLRDPSPICSEDVRYP